MDGMALYTSLRYTCTVYDMNLCFCIMLLQSTRCKVEISWDYLYMSIISLLIAICFLYFFYIFRITYYIKQDMTCGLYNHIQLEPSLIKLGLTSTKILPQKHKRYTLNYLCLKTEVVVKYQFRALSYSDSHLFNVHHIVKIMWITGIVVASICALVMKTKLCFS